MRAPGLVNAAGSPRMWPKFRLFVTGFERQAVVHRKCEDQVLYDHAYLAGRVGRLHYHRLAYRRANGAGKTMQYSAAIRSAGALVVLAPYRRTKMLVRRQNCDFKIVVAVVPACEPNNCAHGEVQRPIRFTSLATL